MAQTYKTVLFSGGDRFELITFSFLCPWWKVREFDLAIFALRPLSWAFLLVAVVVRWVDTANRLLPLPTLGFYT